MSTETQHQRTCVVQYAKVWWNILIPLQRSRVFITFTLLSVLITKSSLDIFVGISFVYGNAFSSWDICFLVFLIFCNCPVPDMSSTHPLTGSVTRGLAGGTLEKARRTSIVQGISVLFTTQSLKGFACCGNCCVSLYNIVKSRPLKCLEVMYVVIWRHTNKNYVIILHNLIMCILRIMLPQIYTT